MSDDFDDDSFFVDDSFLREVDNITAKASTAPIRPSTSSTLSNNFARASSLHAIGTAAVSNKGWTGPQQRNDAGPSSRQAPITKFQLPKPPTSKPSTTTAAPSRRNFSAPTLPFRPPQPSSDDYDNLPLPHESLLSFDSTNPSPTSLPRRQDRPSARPPNPPILPSSNKGSFQRSSSGSNGHQTHLNFFKADQSTKGKRWDRTAFAETGRRIAPKKLENGKVRGKGKGKTKFDWEDDEEDGDEEEEEEEDEDVDNWSKVVPGPKPFVDPNAPYGPQRHQINPITAGTYLYPKNRPKRDYQFEIVEACFTDNTLVALPTGLGKTFVAGVVMLNFYRWFPTGKIVFLAPTRPLVNQQIEACQMTCGIPSKDAAVMTGQSVSAKERARLWDERRVFYCTPQTLDNDLKKGSVDPKDIVLAVFDEAHKASGHYAYTTILAYITAHHPFFRVLALTATPGADVPKVQAVVDALHISRIEIREAEDPKVSRYMNEKRTEKHAVPMSDIIVDFRDRWADLMRPYVTKMVKEEVLDERDLDVTKLKPYKITVKRQKLKTMSGKGWCNGPLNILEKMSRAMGSLLEFSIGMFHTTISEIAGGTSATGKKSNSKASAGSIRNNVEFQKLLRDVEAEMNMIRIKKDGRTKADRHPKMAKTVELLLEHFSRAEEDEKEPGVKNDTRAMVFCTFRECVMEIVDALNEHSGLIKATKFVGQSAGKQENDKGFNQKEQKKTINDFKEGKYNVLVSTSIGEEGLDIGEVDFVVIYDMPKQSIKLLQRVGRTGRKRDGQVHVLMSEGREDTNWETAQRSHREIQKEIFTSRNLELFDDVEKLLPRGRAPICVNQMMTVDAWNPDDQKAVKVVKEKVVKEKGQGKEKGKGKEKSGRGHEIPEGAIEGFKSVADLLKMASSSASGKEKVAVKRKNNKDKGGATKKRGREASPVVSDEEEEEEEDVEEDLELLFSDLAKSKSAARIPKEVGGRPAPKRSRKSEDAPKEMGKAKGKGKSGGKGKEKHDSEEEETQRRNELNRSALDFFNTEGPTRRREARRTPPTSSPPESPITRPTHLPLSPPITDESLNQIENQIPQVPESMVDTNDKLTPRTAAIVGFSQIGPMDLSWDENEVISSPCVPVRKVPSQIGRVRHIGLARPSQNGNGNSKTMGSMAPPPVPPHRVSSPLTSKIDVTPGMEATQFPIRRAGMGRVGQPPLAGVSSVERAQRIVSSDGSPMLAPNRLRRRRIASSSPDPHSAERPVRPKKGRAGYPQVKKYLDLDVEISGSESSDEPLSDHSTHSDRVFAGEEFNPTQAPRGYNQRAIYMAGMSTQAAPKAGLAFKSGVDKMAFLAKARKPVLVSDEEDAGSENEYELGSFVCEDEVVDFSSQTDPLSCL